MNQYKNFILRTAITGAVVFTPAFLPVALVAEQAESIEEVVVVGSRRPGRVATDSPVPVDVLSGEEFENIGTNDMDDILRNLLPSYNVQRYSISDAATITRPATLRGLPPDSTLVLVNNKRRHRAAVIAELGGSLASGSQGVDVSVIPPIAIDRLEVLRDGASAQYGSDAIAGVLNYRLKTNRQGFSIQGKLGETFEGDGDTYDVSANIGLPLGRTGFISLSGAVRAADATNRSLQRTDAQALIDTGNTNVREPHAQIYGAPEVDDDISFFLNAGLPLGDKMELYGFGNFAERSVTGGFFFRNPNNRSGVFTGGNNIRAVVDMNLLGESGQTSNCPVLRSPGGTPTDQAAVDADREALANLPDNCWVANFMFPGGYTPAFGGDSEDMSGLIGLRGETGGGFTWDVSASLGTNEVAYRIGNTWNPSLGPESPTSFNLGTYVQTDQNINADFVMPVNVGASSPLFIAFGFEYRVEEFEIKLGQRESWVAGPYAFVGDNFYSDGTTRMVPLSIGAHGFAGFGPTQVGTFERANYAGYVDLEIDITEKWLVGLAFRFEDFDDFGTTSNYKVAARYGFTDYLSFRASYSTGFRAPTPGQSNVTKVSTITVDNVLQQRGQIPPTNPVARFLGGEALDAESATNFSMGFAWDVDDRLTLTADFFEINVEDRITQTGTIATNNLDPLNPADNLGSCPNTYGLADDDPRRNLSTCLEELGIPGASDLTSVSFFTNDFETTTSGIDLVATYSIDWGRGGTTSFTAAWNWTETEVNRAGTEVSRDRLLELENFNPKTRSVVTANHLMGNWRFLVRASWYDEWIDGDYSGDPFHPDGATTTFRIDCTMDHDNCYDGEWLLDIEGAYTITQNMTIILGVQNVLDNFGPDDLNNTSTNSRLSNSAGSRYATTSPFGVDGGLWYVRFRADL